MKMIKNKTNSTLLTIIFFLVLFLTTPIKTQAQESVDFDTAYIGYTQSFVAYESARRDYVLARSQYLQFKTLKSRNDAREATFKMLAARDVVLINYFTVLRERVRENPGIEESVSSLLIIRLEEEINWYTEHKFMLASAETPEDLVGDSLIAKTRFEDMSILIYETLIAISYGKISDQTNRSADIYSQIQNKIEEIKNEQSDEAKVSVEKLQKIDGWLVEADQRIVRAREKNSEAYAQIVNLSDRHTRDFKKTYDNARKLLEESNQYTRRSLSYLKEVIKEVKIAEN